MAYPRKHFVVSGQRFGRLTVIQEVEPNTKPRMVECYCDCGARSTVALLNLVRYITRSCGCLLREVTRGRSITHGQNCVHQRSPEYDAWAHMIQRCENPNDRGYKNYGGRGIRVCERWRNSFEVFFADVGKRPSKYHSLERIDVNGDYEPGNVRWATRTEQNRNARKNVWLTVKGERKLLVDWERITGKSGSAISRRLKRGWSEEDAVLKPLRITSRSSGI